MTPRDPSPLTRRLNASIETLRTMLAEISDSTFSGTDTAELVQLEEKLAIANEAAKEAISIRRRLAVLTSGAVANPAAANSSSRALTAPDGTAWSVFAVRPSTGDGRPVVRERYRNGWLSFDSGTQTRRFAPIPANWETVDQAELLAFWTAAEIVRVRGANPDDSKKF